MKSISKNKKYFTKQITIFKAEKYFLFLALLFFTLVLSQPTMAKVVLEDQLIAHWPLLEETGIVANDTSGNGHHGTLNNAPTWSDSGLIFDGQDDYVDLGTLDVLSQELTLSAAIQSIYLHCRYRT